MSALKYQKEKITAQADLFPNPNRGRPQRAVKVISLDLFHSIRNMTSHSTQIVVQPLFFCLNIEIHSSTTFFNFSVNMSGLHLESLWKALTDFILLHSGQLRHKGFALKTGEQRGWRVV